MYHLVLTACIAVLSQECGPILLPAGDSPGQAGCRANAGRIVREWLETRPTLVAKDHECLHGKDLAALELQEVAEGVHVFLGSPVQMEDTPDGRIANLAVIIGLDSVAVVDTGISRRQAQEFMVAIRRLTALPVSHVILTHMHPDHVLGSSFFSEAGATILAHPAMPLALAARAQSYLDATERLYGRNRMLGTEIVMPDATIDGRAEIDLGGRKLLLRTATTAHTDNDLTVFDRKTGTFFTGDLLFRELTPALDGSLMGWLRWGEMPPSPPPQKVVPGHGPVADDWDGPIAKQQEFLSALRDATRSAIDAGLPMSRAVPQIVEVISGLRADWRSFDATVARNATASFKELEWEQ